MTPGDLRDLVLHDQDADILVVVGTPSDGDAPIWNASSGEWEPGSAGYAPPDGETVVTQVTEFGRVDLLASGVNDLNYLNFKTDEGFAIGHIEANNHISGTRRWMTCYAREDVFIAGDGGTTVVSAQTSAPADATLSAFQNDYFLDSDLVAFWVDEAGSKLKFKVRYNAGTFKTGEVALT